MYCSMTIVAMEQVQSALVLLVPRVHITRRHVHITSSRPHNKFFQFQGFEYRKLFRSKNLQKITFLKSDFVQKFSKFFGRRPTIIIRFQASDHEFHQTG